MQCIELRHVKSGSGTWREILPATDSLLQLRDFDISIGETPTRSERFHLAQTALFTAKNIQYSGLFGLDRNAFINLKHKVKLKRAVARRLGC